MGTLREDLARDAERVEETHISLVFLREHEVYKVKKPVSLGFLDYGTIEKRRVACEDEVALNRRLAPHVYLGVVPVLRGADGTHRIGSDTAGQPAAAEVVDWAVRMIRLDDRKRADIRLAEGRLPFGHLDRLAARMAAFHAASRADAETAAYGSAEAIARNVIENFEQTRSTVSEAIDPAQAREVEAWQRTFLTDHADQFAVRAGAGRVRDCHGDLRLEHVYFEDDAPATAAVTVIDCIEFSKRLRYGDVCSDVAFLAMDLAWHERPDLAERFLAAYARESNDFDLYPLVDFYESYRAYVRGKVASILAHAEEVDHARRERAAVEARRYYLLALASERRPLDPARVIAVGGVIGAGKSTIAEALAAELAMPVISSDRTRKFLLGAEPTERLTGAAWAGSYAADVTERVYAEVLRRAAIVLGTERGVILDASFRSRDQRESARELATRAGVPFTFVECRAAPDLCKARLVARAERSGVSDGRIELFDEFVARWEPVERLAAAEHVTLDTAEPIAANVRRVRDGLPLPT